MEIFASDDALLYHVSKGPSSDQLTWGGLTVWSCLMNWKPMIFWRSEQVGECTRVPKRCERKIIYSQRSGWNVLRSWLRNSLALYNNFVCNWEMVEYILNPLCTWGCLYIHSHLLRHRIISELLCVVWCLNGWWQFLNKLDDNVGYFWVIIHSLAVQIWKMIWRFPFHKT